MCCTTGAWAGRRLTLISARGFCACALGWRNGDDHSGDHREEPENTHDDQLHCNTDDEGTDAREHEDRAVHDIAIRETTTAGRRNDIGVIAHEMALHLVEQTLLLFGEWHEIPLGLDRWHDSTRAVDY